jgi:hypothetical protein
VFVQSSLHKLGCDWQVHYRNEFATCKNFTFVAIYDVLPHGDFSVNGNVGLSSDFVYHTYGA